MLSDVVGSVLLIYTLIVYLFSVVVNQLSPPIFVEGQNSLEFRIQINQLTNLMMKRQVMTGFLLFSQIYTMAQIGIGTDDPRAILHIESGESGVLIPRLTQAVVGQLNNAAEGELIWVSDEKCFKYFTGGKWLFISFCTSGGEVGAQPLTEGKVGIGTENPAAALEIVSASQGVIFPKSENPSLTTVSPTTSEIIWDSIGKCYKYFVDGNWNHLTECN